MSEFAHAPVMVDEVVALFGPVPAGVLVDATVGGGGHAEALLRTHDHLSLLGLDRAEDALAAVSTLTEGPLVVVGSSMGGWQALLLAREIPARIAGMVADPRASAPRSMSTRPIGV